MHQNGRAAMSVPIRCTNMGLNQSQNMPKEESLARHTKEVCDLTSTKLCH
jgi:hypothetical protein